MSTIVDDLTDLYESPAGGELYDEAVSEREHALQSAELALERGCADELVVACLLHDVGHLLVERQQDRRHQALGADYLTEWFPESVTVPIALHVDAKRYLCGTEPDYFDGLSASSVTSLAQQGGPMNAAEAAEFISLPHAPDAVALRRIDDAAKVAGKPTRPFSAFGDHLRRVENASRRT